MRSTANVSPWRAKESATCFCRLVVLLLLSPIMLLAAAAVKCTSKGPVFYRQVRVGMLAKEFRILKFRSMVVNADKSVPKLR